jgi:RecA-family ATPase
MTNVIPLKPARELPTEEPFRVHYADELVQAQEIEWLVPDLIPFGTVSVLAGAPFLGKTMLCQQLMLARALGKPWFGRPVAEGRSFAIFSEDPHEQVLIPRRDRILAYYGAEREDIDPQTASWYARNHVNHQTFDPTLMRFRRFATEPDRGPTAPRLWEKVADFCESERITLLILDNASTVLEGNEPSQVMAFCRFLVGWAVGTGTAIVLPIHPPKDGSSIISGTDNWRKALRHILVLERGQKPRDMDEYEYQRTDDGKRVLRLHESNWTGERPRIYMRRERNGVLVEDDAPVDPKRNWPLSRSERHELELACVKAVRTVIERGGKVLADMEHAHSIPSRSRRWASWQRYTREQIDDAMAEAIKAGYLKREGKEIVAP